MGKKYKDRNESNIRVINGQMARCERDFVEQSSRKR